MSRVRLLAAMALAGVALLLNGCNALKIDPKDEAAGRLAYAQLHDGQFDALLAHSTAELNTPDVKTKLAQVRALLPSGQPRSMKTIGWSDFRADRGNETLNLAQEYDYGDKVVLAQTVLVRGSRAAPWLVRGLHTQTATRAELAAAADLHVGMDTQIHQIGFLLATVLSPLLMLIALAKVVLTKGLKRKWLWGILAFVGLFSFQMNWMTGAIWSQWLTVRFIGAGIAKGASQFDPWILTVTFPIGALLILSGVWARPKKKKPEPKVRTELADS